MLDKITIQSEFAQNDSYHTDEKQIADENQIKCFQSKRLNLKLSILVLATLLVLPQAFAQGKGSSLVSDQFTHNNKHAYMGVGSCSSSNCHGSVSPRNASNVLQNEYVTWQKHDAHSKAWTTLSNEDSVKIAKNLGIAAADKEPLCLKCHSTYLESATRQGANMQIQDGVGCESCHGAAEHYLGTHTAKDSTHARNLNDGMFDIVSDLNRVKLCATCHFGTEDKYVDHRLIGAGHPRLTFELDTFSMIQPKHWVVDEDYKSRKADYNSARAWLTGQVFLAETTIDRLASDRLSKSGIFPELTIFYCYSCHHSLTEDQWKSREYGGKPGELLLNVSSLVIVEQALKVLNPALAAKMSESIKNLHENYKKGVKTDLNTLKSALSESFKHILAKNLSEKDLKKLLAQLLSYGKEGGAQQYEVAEQIAMGMSSIIATLSPDGSLYKQDMENIFAALKNPEEFKAEEFTAACKGFAF